MVPDRNGFRAHHKLQHRDARCSDMSFHRIDMGHKHCKRDHRTASFRRHDPSGILPREGEDRRAVPAFQSSLRYPVVDPSRQERI